MTRPHSGNNGTAGLQTQGTADESSRCRCATDQNVCRVTYGLPWRTALRIRGKLISLSPPTCRFLDRSAGPGTLDLGSSSSYGPCHGTERRWPSMRGSKGNWVKRDRMNQWERL